MVPDEQLSDFSREEGRVKTEAERFEDADLEDWSNAVTSQGTPAAISSWRR